MERELVGGECWIGARPPCIPSKTLLRPGEAVQAARDARASAEVDVEAALAWRDFMGGAAPAARARRGRVGVELAQAVRRLGGEVALIDRAKRVLRR